MQFIYILVFICLFFFSFCFTLKKLNLCKKNFVSYTSADQFISKSKNISHGTHFLFISHDFFVIRPLLLGHEWMNVKSVLTEVHFFLPNFKVPIFLLLTGNWLDDFYQNVLTKYINQVKGQRTDKTKNVLSASWSFYIMSR